MGVYSPHHLGPLCAEPRKFDAHFSERKSVIKILGSHGDDAQAPVSTGLFAKASNNFVSATKLFRTLINC